MLVQFSFLANADLLAKDHFLKHASLYLINGHLYSSRPFTFNGDFNNSENVNFVSVGVAVPFRAKLQKIQFEAETDVAKFYGQKEYFEWNIFFVAKISSVYRSSIGLRFGSGFSFAEIIPPFEVKEKGGYLGKFFLDIPTLNAMYLYNKPLVYTSFQKERTVSNRMLSFWMLELDYSIHENLGIFVRLQQRSGTLGLYCRPEPVCGSGYIGTGLRTAF